MLQCASAGAPAAVAKVAGKLVLLEATEFTADELSISARERETEKIKLYGNTEFSQPHSLFTSKGDAIILGWEASHWNHKDWIRNKASHQSNLITTSGLTLKSEFDPCEGREVDDGQGRQHTERKDVGASALMHASSPMFSDQYEMNNRIYGGYWNGYNAWLSTYGCIVEGWNDFEVEGGSVVNSYTPRNLSNEKCVSFENYEASRGAVNTAYQDYDCESMFFFSDTQRTTSQSKMPSIGFLQGCVASDENLDYLFGGLTVDGKFRSKLVIVNRTSGSSYSHLFNSSINVFGHSCVITNGELTSYGGFSTCNSPEPPIYEEAWYEVELKTEPLGKCLGWIDENYATKDVNKLWSGKNQGLSEYFEFQNDFECANHFTLNLSNFHLTSASPNDLQNCLAMRTGVFLNGTLALFGGIDKYGQTENRVDIIDLENQSQTNHFDMHLQRIQPIVQLYDNGSFSITGGNSGNVPSGKLYMSIEWLASDGRTVFNILEATSSNSTPGFSQALFFGAIFVALLYRRGISSVRSSLSIEGSNA